MDNETLRKVQLVQLEMAKEVKRVCRENGINYFLDSGTLLGAVRHKGFIPWDDDLDLGMLREDYEKFCRIAPSKLSSRYYLQTWDNDSTFALPYAKLRKKGTIYQEKKSENQQSSGFFIDIFPFDYALENEQERSRMVDRLVSLERRLLMKCHYTPWEEEGGVNRKKKAGYLYYRAGAALASREELIRHYKELVESVPASPLRYEQTGKKNMIRVFDGSIWNGQRTALFEDTEFSVPYGTEKRLETEYGDYMTPPPEDQRENRHMIVKLDFGPDGETKA